jgi:hypothetical protein
MLIAGAFPHVGERGDIRALLSTADARELLMRLAELSGRPLVLLGNEGEEVCRSDDGPRRLFGGSRGALAPIDVQGVRLGMIHLLGADAESVAGQSLARLIAACVIDRALAALAARRSPFAPLTATERGIDQVALQDLRRILNLLHRASGAGAMTILQRRGATPDLLDLLLTRGIVAGSNVVLRAAAGPLHAALAADRPLRVTIRPGEHDFTARILGRTEWLLAPVRSEGQSEVLGLLTVGSPPSGGFGAELTAIAEELAELAGNVLARAQSLASGRQILLESIQTLVNVTEGNGVGPGHGARTARLAVRIGAAMGLDGTRIHELEVAASLHDLGKIGTEGMGAEQVREQHAEWGAALLETGTSFSRLAPAVRYHHARWDGEGNVDGRRGEDLPLPARIIAVCDALDHSRGRRGGREPEAGAGPSGVSTVAALATRGGAFDPAVLAAAERVFSVQEE